MTSGSPRGALVAEVARRVPVAAGGGCVRVGIDGVDGAGKTHFALELAEALAVAGRAVEQVSGDDWHHVRARRYAQGRRSPQGFWEDSFDHARLRSEVLEPLGPGGSRRFRRRGHDLRTDEVLRDPVEEAPPGAVLVVDGLFLQRAELEGCFDFVVWLDVPFEETARRMAVRDGTSPDPDDPSMRRYVEAQHTYFRERAPWSRADLVVDNTDVHRPALVDVARAVRSPAAGATGR